MAKSNDGHFLNCTTGLILMNSRSVMKKQPAYFRLRLVSAFIDLSAIFALSILLRFLIWQFTYISLGAVFTATFILYYLAAYLLLDGRMPGKMLTGLRLISLKEETPALKTILFREGGLKGFAGIIVPAYLLPLCFRVWSPVFTLVLETLLFLLSGILLLVFKATWWDRLSATKVVKAEVSQGATRKAVFLSYTIVAALAMIIILQPAWQSRSTFATTFMPAYPVTDETRTDADFIRTHGQDPVDYIFGLYKKYDLVVLSERYHPEYTQYELIFKLLHDPRFASEVGNIYTELGSVSFQDTLNTYLHTPFNNEQDLDKATAILQRNCDALWPL